MNLPQPIKRFIFLWAFCLAALALNAQTAVRTTTTTTTVTEFEDGSVSTLVVTDTVTSPVVAETPRPKPRPDQPDPFITNGAMGHFTWGVDLGSGVDVTSHNMTMFELGANFGYKGGWMRFVGVGAAIASMMDNSSRCYPVFAMARTSFSPRQQLCFMELKAGVSFNSILDYPSQTDFYGSLGVGFTLAHSRKFSSHVILRAIYMPLSPIEIDDRMHLDYHLGYAAIGIGCAF